MNIVKRFYVILQTIACNKKIDVDAIGAYARETALPFVSLYPWYYMPVSVHDTLIHGAVVLENALLPIGMMSEEAQEARNKDLRKYRENFTRKCGRIQNNEDLLRRLLRSSDPVIFSLRPERERRKKLKFMLPEAIALLEISEKQ